MFNLLSIELSENNLDLIPKKLDIKLLVSFFQTYLCCPNLSRDT